MQHELTNSQRFQLIQPGDVIRIDGIRGNLSVDFEQSDDENIRCISGSKGAGHLLQLAGEDVFFIRNWGKVSQRVNRVSSFETSVGVAV